MINVPKSSFYLLIDSLMMISVAALSGIGSLMKFVLIPGFEAVEKYGRGAHLTFLSLDRHEWGTIHFYISIFFLLVLGIHILSHMNQILVYYCKMTLKGKAIILIVLFFMISFISTFWIFVDPEIRYGRGLGQKRRFDFKTESREIDRLHYDIDELTPFNLGEGQNERI